MKGINRYHHFGIRIDWLSIFFSHLSSWPEHHGIGSLQFSAMKTWLKEAEFFDGKQASDTAQLLAKLAIPHPFIWELLWANIAQNSALIRWYLTEIEWGEQLSKSDLILRAGDSLSEASRSNAMLSLLSLLENTPLGGMGLGEVTGNKARRMVHKRGVPQLAQPETLLYLLARKAAETQIFNFSLEQIQEDSTWSPYHLFGLALHECKSALTHLRDIHPDLVRVEFVKNLDNIFLSNAATPLEVIRRVAR